VVGVSLKKTRSASQAAAPGVQLLMGVDHLAG